MGDVAGAPAPPASAGRDRSGPLDGLRSGFALACLVACLGLVVSVVAAVAVQRAEQATADEALARHADLVREVVETEVGRYVDTLRNLAAATGGYNAIDARSFAQAAAARRVQRLPGAVGVVFIIAAGDEQIPEAQEHWRARGQPDLVLRPEGPGDHAFIIYAEGLEPNPEQRDLIGVDAFRVEGTALALRNARRTNDVTVSDTYRLGIDADLPPDRQQEAFLISAPVRGLADEYGFQPFIGWVAIPVRATDFAVQTLARVPEHQADVTVSARQSNGELVRLTTVVAPDAAERTMHRRLVARVAQRQWELQIDAAPATLVGRSSFPLIVLAGGAAVSLLLAALVGVLMTGRSRAEGRVRRATADLREAEEQLRRDRERAEVIASVASALAASGMSTQAIADTITSELVKRIGDQCAVAVYDHERGVLETISTDGADEEMAAAARRLMELAPISIDESQLIAQAARTGRTMFIQAPDPERLVQSVSEPFRDLVAAHPPRYALAAPFHHHGDLLGVIGVARYEDRPFDQHDVGVVEDIAGRAADAVANALLYEKTAEAEQAMRRSRSELEGAYAELAQINADLDHFAATAAHDLRSPLHRISGYSQLLSMEYAEVLDETARGYLATIDESAHHLADLTTDLLTLARVSDVEMSFGPVDLSEVAHRVLENLHTTIVVTDAHVAVGLLPTIEGDAGLLERLLQNLVGNALKYQPPGQTPRVAITAGDADAHGMVEVNVRDNGIGIDPVDAASVFQPFRRLHAETYSGTGLGLAVCARIAQRHGGSIVVRPNPSAGTTFTVTLPLAGRGPAAPAATGADSAAD